MRYPPWRKRTENPCVAGSIPAHTTKPQRNPGLFCFIEVLMLCFTPRRQGNAKPLREPVCVNLLLEISSDVFCRIFLASWRETKLSYRRARKGQA